LVLFVVVISLNKIIFNSLWVHTYSHTPTNWIWARIRKDSRIQGQLLFCVFRLEVFQTSFWF
jgi:uncharacterized membrane protein YeiB